MDKILVWTDGGARNNQDRENSVGGYGIVLQYKDQVKEIYGGEKQATNNRMELTAVIKSLETIKVKHIPVELFLDSSYIANTINKKWYVKWTENGWLNSKKEPVKNQPLWERLLYLISTYDKIEFTWVKGHADNKGNNKADELANRGMDEIQ